MKRQTTEEIEKFGEYLVKVKGYSLKTARSYTSDLKKFADYLEKLGIDSLTSPQVTPNHLRRFLSVQSALKLSSRTLARRIASLKAFYRWAKKRGAVSKNPASFLSNPKLPSRLPAFLTESETEILFENFRPETPKDLRNLMLFKLIYGCGLRISEALNLKIKDYDPSSGSVKISGKGEKTRIIPLPLKLKQELDSYLTNTRPELLENPSNEYVFPGRRMGHISDTLARRNLRKILLRSGLPAKISPHSLRHSLATHLLSRGVDIRIVQEVLGHRSLNTTQIYTHTDRTWLQKIYIKTHPRS